MNIIKKKLLGFGMLLVVGVIFLGVGITKGGETIFVSIGMAYIGVSTVRAIQYYRISKDENRLKQYTMLQTEERVVFLADKSRSFAFVIMIFVEFVGGIIAIFVNQEFVGNILFGMGALQTVLYAVCYKYFSSKY